MVASSEIVAKIIIRVKKKKKTGRLRWIRETTRQNKLSKNRVVKKLDSIYGVK